MLTAYFFKCFFLKNEFLLNSLLNNLLNNVLNNLLFYKDIIE